MKINPNCPRCHGTGWAMYDRNHASVCKLCCDHSRGWALLRKDYGDDNGKWCCRDGCGKMLDQPPQEVTP